MSKFKGTAASPSPIRSPPSNAAPPSPVDVHDVQGIPENQADPPASLEAHPQGPPHAANQSPGNLKKGDIRVEYHPNSKRQTEYWESKDFRNASTVAPKNDSASPSYPPWHPFRTRLDFELCEFIQEAHLNAGQIDSLISLMDEVLKDPQSFTLSGSQDVTNLWSLARNLSEGFTEHNFTCKYKKQDRSYVVWSRPIWEWCTELLNDRDLITELHWDAEKVSIFMEDGGNGPERRIDEPWTADAWWDIQSALPAGAKPFFILLYADKTHLSSFGLTGEKGYPILAHCANIPTETRNSNEIGGARLVGWLPIVRSLIFPLGFSVRDTVLISSVRNIDVILLGS
ncbi:hypothetical protein CPC08DRAFT_638156 [Agrocybe pediades]|nr:hypothetical protein CPC08DRAFT_638156 [Agrocybe pediades]